MFAWIRSIYLVLIWALPSLAAATPVMIAHEWWLRWIAVALAPAIYAISLILVCGFLSVPFQWAIKPCKEPRDLKMPLYRARRLYGLCWTCIYYFPAIYHFALAVPTLRHVLFRLFGYRGNLDFTIYPDTWIRDLAVLDIGEHAYLANGSSLGSNVVLANGKILVDRIVIGANAIVGFHTMVGAGASIGERAEIGQNCMIGFRSTLEKDVLLGAACVVGHHVTIGQGTLLGGCCWIDNGARVAAGLRIPTCTFVPARTHLKTQGDVDQLVAVRKLDLANPGMRATIALASGRRDGTSAP
jgi:acetyltransferase-like isoleucine patch superfamily enzyme